jgi:hypothetical protein
MQVCKPGMMMHAHNPSTWETEAGEFQVRGQSGLHNEILSQNKII